jgi:hypothetical protein
MDANGNASYAQLRAGARAKSYGSEMSQDAAYQGPTSGTSLQRGNLQSTSFVFKSKDLAGSSEVPLPHSADTSTSILGARTPTTNPTPAKPLGD